MGKMRNMKIRGKYPDEITRGREFFFFFYGGQSDLDVKQCGALFAGGSHLLNGCFRAASQKNSRPRDTARHRRC